MSHQHQHLTEAVRVALVVAWAALLWPAAIQGQTPACVLDTNPPCSAAINLGSIDGDVSGAGIKRTGQGEAFFTIRLKEAAAGARSLTARIRLDVPASVDYDLVVRCASCGGAAAASRAGAGASESVAVSRKDTLSDDSVTLIIEVRYRSGSACDAWALSIAGATTPTDKALACP